MAHGRRRESSRAVRRFAAWRGPSSCHGGRRRSRAAKAATLAGTPAGAVTLVQGGTFVCAYQTTSGPVSDYSQQLATGTSGSIALTPTAWSNVTHTTPPPKLHSGTTCTLSGVVPAGWSITVEDLPLSLAAHSGNTGTVVVTNPSTSAAVGTVSGATFDNQGTFALRSTKVSEVSPPSPPASTWPTSPTCPMAPSASLPVTPGPSVTTAHRDLEPWTIRGR